MAVGNSAMKASLVLMLLFGAVVAAHATTVKCKNNTCKEIKVNGVVIGAGQALDVVLNAAGDLVIEVLDALNKLLTGTVHIPYGVTEVDCVTVDGKFRINVVGVLGGLLGVLAYLLNTVLEIVGDLFNGIICLVV